MCHRRRTPSFALVNAGICLLAVATTSCTSVSRPCSDGGEPAREAKEDQSGRKSRWQGTKQCFQRRDPQGKLLNHGRYVEWYPSGRVALEGEYKMGLKHGKWLEYDESGKLVSERWFESGKETDTRTKKAEEQAAVKR